MITIKNSVAMLPLLLSSALFCAQASAKLQIGEVLRMSGAKATVNGKMFKVAVPLFWGDRLFAGPDSTLEVLLYPSTSFKLKPSSEVRFVGNLLSQAGSVINASSVIQVLKGKLQGQVNKSPDVKNEMRIVARKTVSSIRGTTFEVEAGDGEEADSVGVFEGEIEVQSLAEAEEASGKSIPVSGGQELAALDKPTAPLKDATPVLATPAEVKTSWDQNSVTVLSHHQKEAKKYRAMLDKDTASMFSGLRKDAQGMFKSTKGAYDQFKKKKN